MTINSLIHDCLENTCDKGHMTGEVYTQDIFLDNQGTLDVPLAEQLVKRWHGVKAQALGASHNTELLADVLEGSMLKQWRDRAQYVKRDGW